MMNHKGTQTIVTPRLILRRYRPEDAPAMFRNWASDPEVTKYLTWPTHDAESVTEWVIGDWVKRYDQPAVYHWGLELKDCGELIGDIAVVHMAEPVLEAELGWCMGRAWWGKGYMPEAARAVSAYLFDAGFNRIMAGHDVENQKSGRVMQKIGMRLEGIHRQAGRNNQGIVDMAIYAMLRSDFS